MVFITIFNIIFNIVFIINVKFNDGIFITGFIIFPDVIYTGILWITSLLFDNIVSLIYESLLEHEINFNFIL